ncbi:MAG TPA: flagellinolysin [Steroidobacteraceae bacterium]|nr:flagellinolysin [Steroidobacteraceae bacterium]
MQINTNIAALNSHRMLSRATDGMERSLQRLSSGLRINSARDDAAGLAISERMTAQIRGFNQAARNANDAVSLLQTAEGGLSEVANILQRGRELALQAANATYGSRERESLQAEINQLIAEVDRIGKTTDFNGVKILGGGAGGAAVITGGPDPQASDKLAIIDALKRSWLQQGEAMVEQFYGIKGDGKDIEVKFVDGAPYLAAVSFTGYEVATGKLTGMTLNVDFSDFNPADWPNGSGSGFVNNDRIIAHELTHAIMARSMDMHDLPLWFIEGTAEFIHGADARLYGDITATAGGSTAAKVASLMSNYLTANGSVQLYSAGYAAARYIHKEIIDNGGQGIKEVFDYLSTHTLSTLDDALGAVATAHAGMDFNSVATMTPLFAAGQAGNTYIAGLYDGGSLTNADTGAIGGADSTPGGTRNTTANGVVPDTSNFTEHPLNSLNATFAPVDTTSRMLLTLSTIDQLQFQVGANANQTITVEMRAVQASTLNLTSVDVKNHAQYAISIFDAAIDAVASERGRLGAVQGRVQLTVNNLSTMNENISASRSRIVDTDYAIETATLTRNQILRQAGAAIAVQANASPIAALQLLKR